jgi:xanthine dehydrogenase accessory factor
MTDIEPILTLWRSLREGGTEYVLGTIIEIEGSSYRKPGARILIGADGRRTGTISGGCLESEVARKAFWHTENGPGMQRYSTAAVDGDVPYGMGCGGAVQLFLERSASAEPVLARLAAEFEARGPVAIATVIDGHNGGLKGAREFWPDVEGAAPALDAKVQSRLTEMARRGFDERRSFSESIVLENERQVTVRVEWNPGRPGLFVFGAGDDAIPLVRQARQLGWHVVIADGRSNLVTKARFPDASEVRALNADEAIELDCQPTDAVVVMTHSMEQDTRALRALLRQEWCYIGVLGPLRRTREMLVTLAKELRPGESEKQVVEWLTQIHAPMGLDLGGETPADIALAVMAEIQKASHGASGESLTRLRRQRHRQI